MQSWQDYCDTFWQKFDIREIVRKPVYYQQKLHVVDCINRNVQFNASHSKR